MKAIKKMKKRTLSTILAIAIVLAGITTTPPMTAKAARYEYTYSTGIPSRTVDCVDGVVTYIVAGNSYQLTLRLTAADAACDQYGTCFMEYKNGAMYWASYELEGTSLVKHRLIINNKQVYARKLLFKGSNKQIATHYEYNGVEYPLPTLEELRASLGGTATQEPTQVPTQAPTQEPTKEPTQAPTQEPTKAPTQSPTPTPDIHAETETHTEFDVNAQWEEALSGMISWEEFWKAFQESKWSYDKELDKTTDLWTYYFYDENGNKVAEHTVGTETTKETGEGIGNSETNSKVEGSAEYSEKTEGKAEVTGTADTKTETNIDLNNGGSSGSAVTVTIPKNKAKEHVKISGSKIQWLDKNNVCRYTAHIKRNGKFKLRTVKGKKVVYGAGGFIKKYKTFILRLKDGTQYVINLNNFKVAKLKEKGHTFLRGKNGFVTYMVLKSGKKVNVKNLKVTKGKYAKNKDINKVSYKISYKKLIK